MWALPPSNQAQFYFQNCCLFFEATLFSQSSHLFQMVEVYIFIVYSIIVVGFAPTFFQLFDKGLLRKESTELHIKMPVKKTKENTKKLS